MCATKEGQNDYEPAFESWLCEQKVRYSRVDQTHRCVLNDNQTKTFDYLISLKRGGRVLVELKGRVFHGASLAGRRGLECWVQEEDVSALGVWRERFTQEHPQTEAVFVFVYRLEKMVVEEDGLEVYDVGGQRYVFLAIRHEDYRRCMKQRSPRWKTVTLSAGDFRAFCFPAERIWLGDEYDHERNDTNAG